MWDILPLSRRCAIGKSVSFINVDFPEPETPVIHVSSPTGKLTVTFLRLLPVAPLTVSERDFFLRRRLAGMAISSLPDRNAPVKASEWDHAPVDGGEATR